VSEYVHKSHNVSVLIYHLVFPAKYRRAVFDEDVDTVMKEICIEIEDRYQMKFLEIGTDKDHVHFLVQSVPTYTVTKIVSTIKSLTVHERSSSAALRSRRNSGEASSGRTGISQAP